ncbi:TIGR02328 family protein [Facklamia sp. 7083-14-GEN3]|uniref:TIGR02328 family protein n=1 Tax=Facklamia sp. 7083-14-GEN3 TaxID=2973478 RepID=UPI00215D0CF7|nr:TIGR02328 family protein [Facklamia sp. 7083-14-GEN3]MCR8969622.1 TIGR02328 family protein [Facklamia sp. 7083-14-GEN3]
MRLWHQDLIALLPRQQLLGQHRECCALRGKGWGKPHATVNYVFNYPPYKLYQYHLLVMEEMLKRGYQPDEKWMNPNYRGKAALDYDNLEEMPLDYPIYFEHDEEYLQECLDNLKAKGIVL